MSERLHPLVKLGRLATTLSLLSSQSACLPHRYQTPSSGETFPSTTEYVSPPFETVTPIPTSTITPAPTPDWWEINVSLMEEALSGEEVTLKNIEVPRIVVLHPPFTKDLIFGAITDEEGNTQALFENFDCQYRAMRGKGELRKVESDTPLLTDVWDTSGTTFDELRVTKKSELPRDIEVFESNSFVLEGKKIICPEVPITEPASEFARKIYSQAKEIVIKILDSLTEKR